MADLFGFSRTTVMSRYALLAPDSFVPSNLPGWSKACVVLNISPVMNGPRFSQLLITLAADGIGRANTGAIQHFIYVIGGAGSITQGAKSSHFEPGSYVYLPPNTAYEIRSAAPDAQLLMFQKPYVALPGLATPQVIVGHERDIAGEPFLGNEDARLQKLLPDRPEFDMAVNIFTYQPGATLPFVESHIMEHGLLMLRGQGVYRLDSDYHPVREGDVIWMASYCPQWFVAMGKTPASYIYYKDVNRDPL